MLPCEVLVEEKPKVKKPKTQTTQEVYEKEWLKKEMTGFDIDASPAWQFLDANFRGLTKETLLALAQVASQHTNVSLTREYTRRKQTLVKWFHNSWNVFCPFLRDQVYVVYDD
jgi:hypothetical protein